MFKINLFLKKKLVTFSNSQYVFLQPQDALPGEASLNIKKKKKKNPGSSLGAQQVKNLAWQLWHMPQLQHGFDLWLGNFLMLWCGQKKHESSCHSERGVMSTDSVQKS